MMHVQRGVPGLSSTMGAAANRAQAPSLRHPLPSHRRGPAPCRFIPERLATLLPFLPTTTTTTRGEGGPQATAAADKQSRYSTMLQQAERITLPSAGAAGHGRCSLQDAERMLELCILERPRHLPPRVLLLRNLLRQSGGRERHVPALAIAALQEAGAAARGDTSMAHNLHVLQIVLLGLKAVYKLQEVARASIDGDSMRTPPRHAAGYTPASFLAAACAAAPGFAADFASLALRVQRQLRCCSDEARRELLRDTDGYLSSVDLSVVYG